MMHVQALWNNNYHKMQFLTLSSDLVQLRNDVDDLRTKLEYREYRGEEEREELLKQLPKIIDEVDQFIVEHAVYFFAANAPMNDFLMKYKQTRAEAQLSGIDADAAEAVCTEYYKLLTNLKIQCELIKDWVAANDQLQFKAFVLVCNSCIFLTQWYQQGTFMRVMSMLEGNSTNSSFHSEVHVI